MTLDLYKQILNEPKQYEKLIEFVRALKRIIPLEWLDINDWQCNTSPGVYVHGRTNRFKTRRYCRCSKYDLKLAVRFFQNN